MPKSNATSAAADCGVLSRRRKSEGRQLFAGLYAEDLVQLSAQWRVVAGARIDRWRATASLVRRTLKTEQAKYRIADQRDDLATNRGRGHLEIAAKEVQEGFGREPVGKFRRVSQIAVPQRSGDLFPIATPN